MKVKELIEALEHEDPDAIVVKLERGSYVTTFIAVEAPGSGHMRQGNAVDHLYYPAKELEDESELTSTVEL